MVQETNCLDSMYIAGFASKLRGHNVDTMHAVRSHHQHDSSRSQIAFHVAIILSCDFVAVELEFSASSPPSYASLSSLAQPEASAANMDSNP